MTATHKLKSFFSRAEAPFNHPTFQNREATHIFVVNETDFGPRRLESSVKFEKRWNELGNSETILQGS